MGAYDTLEKAIKGLIYGIIKRIEGGWVVADSNGIRFGAPVFGYVGDENKAYNFYNDTGKLVFDGDFVTSNVITITVNGEDAADVTFDTNHDTTAALVVAAVAALDGVECVLDPADTNNRTFLIRTKGATAVVAEAITGGGGQATGTATYGSGQVFVGVSCFTQKQPELGVSEFVGYAQYDSVNVMADGELWVEVGDDVEAQNEAYVDNAGADAGEWSNAGVEVNARYRSNALDGGLARLYVYGQKEMTYASSF